MTITLAREQVSEMDPLARVLPEWDTTPHTPSEMAERGVPHGWIVWAFLRPAMLGDAFGDVVCKVAETVLPVFERASPGDTRPRDAIEAARRCFDNPTAENKTLASEAEAAAREAVRDAVMGASRLMGGAASAKKARASARAGWTAVDAARSARAEAARGAAAMAAMSAVAAGCPPATVLSIIEGAGQ